MRTSTTKDGLTLRAIAGAYNIILGIDLDKGKRKGCLGFTISRTDLGSKKKKGAKGKSEERVLPNSLQFPSDTSDGPITTETAPLQKFRWGDYTAQPGNTYRYKVTARYGSPGKLTKGATAKVTVTTEDPTSPNNAVFFNRGAAASQAYNAKFGQDDPDKMPPAKRKEALAWLSRGLEEAALAFLAEAKDEKFALHAAIYEFQKPELLQGLAAALKRDVDVKVVYHSRHKPPGVDKETGKPKKDSDQTYKENQKAAKENGLAGVSVKRKADPQGAIMHNKFVVLLKKGKSGEFEPQAVWTGSMNWTEGGVYGQLNVGHAVYDRKVAEIYESCFQLLHKDTAAKPLKAELANLTKVPSKVPEDPGVYPLLSPQSDDTMLKLYASICKKATCLLVCAPFELSPIIRETLKDVPKGTLRFLLLDKKSSLGKPAEIKILTKSDRNEIGYAATLETPLSKYQEKLLKKSPEHFHHRGIHIHSKIIVADPFSSDPILVTGSANFSKNSTVSNDSNSLLIRGNTAVADIYTTEFMRMFEHYHFRGAVADAKKKAGKKSKDKPLSLKEDDSWSAPYYVDGSQKSLDRQFFAGTLG